MILVPTTVSAKSLWDAQEDSGIHTIGEEAFGSTNPEKPRDIRAITVSVIKVFLTIVMIVMFIMVLLAGFKWMTAGGNEEQITGAKAQIKNASIGLAIILSSYMLTDFIGSCIMQAIDGWDVWGCG